MPGLYSVCHDSLKRNEYLVVSAVLYILLAVGTSGVCAEVLHVGMHYSQGSF